MKRQLVRLTVNLKPEIRYDVMEGRDYIVVPAVIMREGVVTNSAGRSLYSRDHISIDVNQWDYKPIVVNHPEKDGQYISACSSPEVITNYKVGVLMATNGKVADDNRFTVSTECWLEKERLEELAPSILEDLEAGREIEVSVGAFTEDDLQSGDFNGKKYDRIATNFRADHLALLIGQKGACSNEDGCGLLRVASDHSVTPWRQTYSKSMALAVSALQDMQKLVVNDISFGDIHGQLYNELASKHGEKGKSWNGWVSDVYKDKVIYYNGEQLTQHDYVVNNNKVALKGEPVQVVRTTKYAPVANHGDGDKEMNKKQVVDGLIANSAKLWAEGDRDYLMGLEEKRLTELSETATRIEANAKAVEDAKKLENNTDCGCPDKQTGKEKDTAPQANAEPKFPNRPMTDEEWAKIAPPRVRETLALGEQVRVNTRNACIATIKANKGNTFTDEKLEAMNLGSLQNLASLAAAGAHEDGLATNAYSDNGQANYSGQAGIAVNRAGSVGDDCGMKMPGIIDYSEKAKA